MIFYILYTFLYRVSFSTKEGAGAIDESVTGRAQQLTHIMDRDHSHVQQRTCIYARGLMARFTRVMGDTSGAGRVSGSFVGIFRGQNIKNSLLSALFFFSLCRFFLITGCAPCLRCVWLQWMRETPHLGPFLRWWWPSYGGGTNKHMEHI